MAREARHFVDEAFFVIVGKYSAEISKKLLNFVFARLPPRAENYFLGFLKFHILSVEKFMILRFRLIKLRQCEKATKFEKISHNLSYEYSNLSALDKYLTSTGKSIYVRSSHS